jgi:hypothetical protein
MTIPLSRGRALEATVLDARCCWREHRYRGGFTRQGADIDAQSITGNTALMEAAQYGSPKIVDTLLKRVLQPIKLLIPKAAQPGGELHPQQIEERKDNVCIPPFYNGRRCVKGYATWSVWSVPIPHPRSCPSPLFLSCELID